MNNNGTVIDTMTRRGAIDAQLIDCGNDTYKVRYQMGSKSAETELLSREDAGILWEKLNTVGMPSYK